MGRPWIDPWFGSIDRNSLFGEEILRPTAATFRRLLRPQAAFIPGSNPWVDPWVGQWVGPTDRNSLFVEAKFGRPKAAQFRRLLWPQTAFITGSTHGSTHGFDHGLDPWIEISPSFAAADRFTP